MDDGKLDAWEIKNGIKQISECWRLIYVRSLLTFALKRHGDMGVELLSAGSEGAGDKIVYTQGLRFLIWKVLRQQAARVWLVVTDDAADGWVVFWTFNET